MILPCIDQLKDFPDVSTALAEPDGLLCFGGDLSTERLLSAYQNGIFPWYSADEPILWWCPSDRMVLFPDKLHISRSLNKAIRRFKPKFYINRDFSRVIQHCAKVPRADKGTWIHSSMISAYKALFQAGHGFCIEVEIDGELVGGMYGVALERIYCGESMFSLRSNGSKFAMYGLCQYLLEHGIELLDCQLHNPHLATMGAELITKDEFLNYLR